eukprot:6318352-Alexandrium_andersonii.AAC.1
MGSSPTTARPATLTPATWLVPRRGQPTAQPLEEVVQVPTDPVDHPEMVLGCEGLASHSGTMGPNRPIVAQVVCQGVVAVEDALEGPHHHLPQCCPSPRLLSSFREAGDDILRRPSAAPGQQEGHGHHLQAVPLDIGSCISIQD